MHTNLYSTRIADVKPAPIYRLPTDTSALTLCSPQDCKQSREGCAVKHRTSLVMLCTRQGSRQVAPAVGAAEVCL